MTEAAINIQARTAYHNERPRVAKGKLRIMTKPSKAEEVKVEPYKAEMPDGSLHVVYCGGDQLYRVNDKIIIVGVKQEKKRGKGTIVTYDFTPKGSAYVTWIQPHVTNHPQMTFQRDEETKQFSPLSENDLLPLYTYIRDKKAAGAAANAALPAKDRFTYEFVLPIPTPENRKQDPTPPKNETGLRLQ